MVERICPQCQHGNPLDNRFCGHCGGSLERSPTLTDGQRHQQPTPSTSLANLVVADQDEVTARLKQVGQAVAVGLATLAAEAGMAWLRRKIEHMGQTPAAPPQHVVYQPVQTHALPQTVVHQVAQPPIQTGYHYPVPQPHGGMVTILSQRVVEVWERGVMTKQTVERNVWRRTQG